MPVQAASYASEDAQPLGTRTSFTINGRTVRFSSSLSVTSGGFVELLAYRTQPDTAVFRSVFAMKLGDDGRVVLGGSGSGQLFRTASGDPLWVSPGDTLVCGGPEAITGMGRLYDKLAIFKEHELYLLSSAFHVSMVSADAGCDCPGSIAQADNRLIWASSGGGVHLLTATGLETERNVRTLSRNIGPLWQAESLNDRRSAQSCVRDGRYCLSVGSHVYVWDFARRPYSGSDPAEAAKRMIWYRFSGFSVGKWLSGENWGYLHKTTGAYVRLLPGQEDGSTPVAACARSPMLDGGQPLTRKRLLRVCAVTDPGETSALTLCPVARSPVSGAEKRIPLQPMRGADTMVRTVRRPFLRMALEVTASAPVFLGNVGAEWESM